MKLDRISYKVTCSCLDDAEPLFILLEKKEVAKFIEAISNLVNGGLLRCSLNSVEIKLLSIEQILENIEENKTTPSDVDKEFCDWHWQWERSLIFSATTKGRTYAMEMFEEAKRRTLKVSEILKNEIDNDINLLQKVDIQFRPYDEFGDWVLASSGNSYLIGFREFEDDNDFYCYDPSNMKWDWISSEKVKYKTF
jgi:hypothetical protein